MVILLCSVSDREKHLRALVWQALTIACVCVQLASLRFASQCEHHMLPFFGEARVLIVMEVNAPPLAPGTLEALLDTCSRRLQIQERLTQELVGVVHSLAGAVPSSSACTAGRCKWSMSASQQACACMFHVLFGRLKAKWLASCSLRRLSVTLLDHNPLFRIFRCCGHAGGVRGCAYVHGGAGCGEACQLHCDLCSAGRLQGQRRAAHRST